MLNGGISFSSLSSNEIFRVFNVRFTLELFLAPRDGFDKLYIWMWKLLQEIREKISLGFLHRDLLTIHPCVMSSTLSSFVAFIR